jgi:hypothetical protein
MQPLEFVFLLAEPSRSNVSEEERGTGSDVLVRLLKIMFGGESCGVRSSTRAQRRRKDGREKAYRDMFPGDLS